ncbi:hypothetical protein MTO96_030156 [Rhipicephalus appendiculatus]
MMEQPGNKTPVAQLTSTVVGPFCFTAWYHQSGTRYSQATFYADTAGSAGKLFYTTQRDMAGQWQRVRYSENRAAKIAIKFECTIKGKKFAHSFCALDAIRIQGCKSNRGSYLFFSNFEQIKGNKAELTGEILTWSSKITQCAEFWYIIAEDPEASLQVQALDTYEPSDFSGKGSPLWEQKGGKSLEWQQGRIAVPHNRKDTSRVSTNKPTKLLVELCEPEGQISVAGNIAYLQGRSLNGNHGTALLSSPLVGPQSNLACFSVSYHMFGGRGATLWLRVVKSPASSGTQTSLPLLIQQGRTTADIWHNVRRTVNLDSVHNKASSTTNLIHAAGSPCPHTHFRSPYYLDILRYYHY